MQTCRRVVKAALAARLKPSCTHCNNLPVSLRWGALTWRCTQRRRKPGLGEVQYSNKQPIADAVYVYVLVYTCPTAVNLEHILRLDRYRCVPQGGQHSRAAGRQSQAPSRNVRFADARASVYTLLLYALVLVVRCPAARCVQKARLTFFGAYIAQRHNVDAGTAFCSIFERSHHRTDFYGGKVFLFLMTDWLVSSSFLPG